MPKVRLKALHRVDWSNLPVNLRKWIPLRCGRNKYRDRHHAPRGGRMMPPTEPSPSNSACIACVESGDPSLRSW
jgi:hypothetical protein